MLPVRIELTTSALPRMRSTTELRQHCPETGGPMAVRRMRCQGKGMRKDDKEARLAAALRENLRKRKMAASKTVVPAQAGTSGDDTPTS